MQTSHLPAPHHCSLNSASLMIVFYPWPSLSTGFCAQLCLTLYNPVGLWPARLLCPWDPPGKNTPPGGLAKPGTEPTWAAFVSCIGRQVLYQQCHLGSPNWVLCFSKSGTGSGISSPSTGPRQCWASWNASWVSAQKSVGGLGPLNSTARSRQCVGTWVRAKWALIATFPQRNSQADLYPEGRQVKR